MKYRDQILSDQEARVLYESLPEGPDIDMGECDCDIVDKLLSEGLLETIYTSNGVEWNQITSTGREVLLRYRRDESIFKQGFATGLGTCDE